MRTLVISESNGNVLRVLVLPNEIVTEDFMHSVRDLFEYACQTVEEINPDVCGSLEDVENIFHDMNPDENIFQDDAEQNGIELDDGTLIEFPDEDGTIRRRDVHGNCEEIRRFGDDNWSEWADLFKIDKAKFDPDTR